MPKKSAAPPATCSGPARPPEQRRVLDRDAESVAVEVHGQVFQGRIDGDRFAHRSYEDWKRLQCLKGKPDWFERNWKGTRDKQIRQWTFAGLGAGETHLEVGFRDGFNLVHLASRGVRTVGIEVNPDAVRHAEALGQEAYEEDIQGRTRFGEGSFDVISACDVLEHCFDPAAALGEMRRILKDSGRLVVEIPFEKEFRDNIAHGHSFLFHDAENARALFCACGFRVAEEDLSDPGRNMFLLFKQQDGGGE